MTKNSISFLSSLKGRILLYLSLPTIIVITIIVVITAVNSFSSAHQQAELAIKQSAELIALEIERHNANAVRTAKIMVQAQEESMFGQRAIQVILLNDYSLSFLSLPAFILDMNQMPLIKFRRPNKYFLMR